MTFTDLFFVCVGFVIYTACLYAVAWFDGRRAKRRDDNARANSILERRR